MPRYTYGCGDCEQEFDIVHHYKDVISECKLCKSTNVSRIINKVFVCKSVKTNKKAGKKVKETISETVEEMKKYRKESSKERKIK